ELALEARGHVEELQTAPRFVARSSTGDVETKTSWDELGHGPALDHLLPFLQRRLGDHRLLGVGHRVVHGGYAHAAPARVERHLPDELERLAPLAPLHQPHNLAAIRLLLDRRPDLPQVACFDTAFHRTSPDLAQRFALPSELHDAGVRRYGFHGLSYEYVASALPRYDGKAAAGRTVVLHLGNGASMCAMATSRAVATTMGFTAGDGLPMGKRHCATHP